MKTALRKLLLSTLLLLSGAILPAQAVVRYPHFATPVAQVSCPRILACSGTRCIDPDRLADETERAQYQLRTFQGVPLPTAQGTLTNFPILNAGLDYLRKHGSDVYLRWALGVVCSGAQANSAPNAIECSGPLLGQPPLLSGDQSAQEIYPVWGKERSLEAQRRACAEYSSRARAAEFTLRPLVQLQTSPYSSEGIAIRSAIGQLSECLPAFLVRCRDGSATAPGTGCRDLVAFMDDLKFALLLSDKLALDAQPQQALELIRAGSLGSQRLAGLASALIQGSYRDDGLFDSALAQLLEQQWPGLRATIQRGIELGQK